MFLENCLLVSLWLVGIWPDRADDWYLVPFYVFVFFFGGILIMVVYYKWDLLRPLRIFIYDWDFLDISTFVGLATKLRPMRTTSWTSACPTRTFAAVIVETTSQSTRICFRTRWPFTKRKSEVFMKKVARVRATGSDTIMRRLTSIWREYLIVASPILSSKYKNSDLQFQVFNQISFSNATKRKKKKPTSFIPPPILNIPGNINNTININSGMNQENGQIVQSQVSNNVSGPMSIPFWRQPLPRNSMAGGSSETEGSVASSRINIQLKLQEKKQKQLAELKIIEEEIKQGKLGRQKVPDPCENDDGGKVSLLPRQPAPRAKKHIDIETIDFGRNSSGSEAENMNILLHQLQQNNENVMYNNFSSTSGGIAAALTKFSHEILTNINIGEKSVNTNKQPSLSSSTMTSTTSENENNSLTRQMVSSRKKLLHHNLGNNLNVQARASPRIASPSCHYDPRQSAYNSLEGKSKTDTNRSSNSKNETCGSINNVNTNSIEKDKSLASQLIKRQMQRGNTPEILLAPNHLESNAHFYQHMNAGAPSVPSRNVICDGGNNFRTWELLSFASTSSIKTFYSRNYRIANGYEQAMDMDDEGDDSQVPSDIDSQVFA